jgi:hypothetical protein
MKKISVLIIGMIATIQFWACSKTEKTPDYTQAMLGTYTGMVIDSGRNEFNSPYVSGVGNSKLIVTADPAGLNLLEAIAYVGPFKSFTAKGKAISNTEVTIDQQAVNAIFSAAGKATYGSNSVSMVLKVNDNKYLKFVGKK